MEKTVKVREVTIVYVSIMFQMKHETYNETFCL